MRAVMAEPFRQPGMSVQKEGLEELVIYRLILLPGNNLPVCISRLWGVNDTFFGVIDMLIDNSIMKDLTVSAGHRVFACRKNAFFRTKRFRRTEGQSFA